MHSEITLSVSEAIATVTLNRPDKLNCLNTELVKQLTNAVASAEAAGRVSVLVLKANGRAFCAGADLSEVARPDASLVSFLKDFGNLLERIEQSHLITVACVDGIACAGGLELLLSCDLVLVSERAQIGDAHINYGLLPGAGASVRLPRQIGKKRAASLMFTGDLWNAAELYDAGLVSSVFATDEFEKRSSEYTAKIAAKSADVLSKTKALLAASQSLTQDEALKNEINVLSRHQSSCAMQEGLSAFLQKREPNFQE